MARDREYELTFTIAPEATERLVAHPKIRPALRDRRVDHLVSTYFDTPDSTLRRHRFGLRVRRGGTRVVHTLKRTGTSLVDRGEWETADAGSRPDAAWLRRTPAAPLLAAGVADALAPCFTVEVTRTTLPLRYGKTRIEAAIDEGAIASGGLSLPLLELALELKAGRRGRARDLARTLVRDLPLALSLASKAERGYGVSSLTWGRADDAIDPALTKGMTIAQVFEAVVQACLHTVLKNAALIVGEADIEPVHKTRIALRHLRAVLALFAPVLRRRRLRSLRGDLKWLSRRLGEARDADVFRHGMFAPTEPANGEMPGTDALVRVMEARRQAVHARLRRALGSARARLLFLDVLAMSESGVRRSRRDKSARRFVRRALERRRRGLVHATKRLDRRSVAKLHDIRKDVKALRYDIALLAGLPGVAAKTQRRRHAKALKTLQESLGVINDEQAMRAHVAAAFEGDRHDLPDGEMRQAASAAAAVLAGRDIRHAPELRRAAKAAKRLRRRLA